MSANSLRSAVCGVVVAVSLGCASFQGARLYQSGTRALDRGETATAIAQLERAAELVPTASEVQNHLGLAYLADDRRSDAERAFRRAAELDCTNQAAAHNLRAFEIVGSDPPDSRPH